MVRTRGSLLLILPLLDRIDKSSFKPMVYSLLSHTLPNPLVLCSYVCQVLQGLIWNYLWNPRFFSSVRLLLDILAVSKFLYLQWTRTMGFLSLAYYILTSTEVSNPCLGARCSYCFSTKLRHAGSGVILGWPTHFFSLPVFQSYRQQSLNFCAPSWTPRIGFYCK